LQRLEPAPGSAESPQLATARPRGTSSLGTSGPVLESADVLGSNWRRLATLPAKALRSGSIEQHRSR
jgi:hypothetical protein